MDTSRTWGHSRIGAAFIAISISFGSLARACADSDDFTDAELRLVDELIGVIKRRCFKELFEFKKILAKELPALSATSLTSSNLCFCMAQEMRSQLNPTMLREGTEADGERLGMRAARSCAIKQYQNSWAEICPVAIRELRSRANERELSASEVAVACGCGRDTIDKLEPVAERMDWRRLLKSSYAAIHSCLRENGLEVTASAAPAANPPDQASDAKNPSTDDVDVVDSAAVANDIVRTFGLEGRWSRDCEETGASMTWTTYTIPSSGAATIESYRGGRPSSTLLNRYTLVSAHPLSDDRVRIFAAQTFPSSIDDRMTVVIQKIGSHIRMMEATVSRYDKVIERIKNGRFVDVLGETPLLEHCTAVK
jgi:hypothetical protein